MGKVGLVEAMEQSMEQDIERIVFDPLSDKHLQKNNRDYGRIPQGVVGDLWTGDYEGTDSMWQETLV